MATTPPHQIAPEARTPPTPLHGSVYHDATPSSRYNTRSSVKRSPEQTQIHDARYAKASRSSNTPKSPRPSARSVNLHSPQSTPRHKSTRRVQVISPSSPDSDINDQQGKKSLHPPASTYTSAMTTSEGMLPTPVKTPKKKQTHASNLAARALFQDQTQIEQMTQSLRKSGKNKRYNGFSLESFSADDQDARARVQIFTDSRDKVPEIDASEENPFVDNGGHDRNSATHKVTGTTKRRKVSSGKKADPQVREAIDNDDGMVYVFRGKKVYRRFDDQGEEEEEIDSDELGLLQHSPDGVTNAKPLKTLTRKSIKPKRLFETEEQKQARLLQQEEEADTEVEDNKPAGSSIGEEVSTKRGQAIGKNKSSSSQLTDPTTSQTSTTSETSKRQGQNGSPFDSWRRIKPGSRPSASSAARARKRTATEAIGEIA